MKFREWWNAPLERISPDFTGVMCLFAFSFGTWPVWMIAAVAYRIGNGSWPWKHWRQNERSVD